MALSPFQIFTENILYTKLYGQCRKSQQLPLKLRVFPAQKLCKSYQLIPVTQHTHIHLEKYGKSAERQKWQTLVIANNILCKCNIHAEKHTKLECTEHSDIQHLDLETNYYQHQMNAPCQPWPRLTTILISNCIAKFYLFLYFTCLLLCLDSFI